MPNPEEGPERYGTPTPSADDGQYLIRFDSSGFKLGAAGTAFITTVALALSVHGKAESLTAKCANEFPPETPGLTLGDYLGVTEDPATGEYHKSYGDTDILARVVQKEVDAYMISPARNNRIQDRVADYATIMVGRANLGDEGYKFYRPGDPGSGYFQGDPHKPVPDDFQGYGWLYRTIHGDDGKVVRQEIVDGIYRFSDGSYAVNPAPGTLSVYDTKSQAVFTAPRDLGLGECELVPGNDATQGWRVDYYDFWPEGELAPPGDIQGETYDYAHNDYPPLDEMSKVRQIENRAIEKLRTESDPSVAG